MVIQQEFDKAFFQSTFSNFVREILAKQIQASKIQMDLLRRFEGKAECMAFHLDIIKHCRKSVDKIDNMLRDVKDYFQDLKINGLYDLFETMFRILVYDIKKISQCYLRRFETYRNQVNWNQRRQRIDNKAMEDVEAGQNLVNLVCICQQKRKEDIRKLEHLDFQIAGIEAKQNVIREQMNFLINNLREEKEKIDKITPSSQKVILEQIEKFCEISKKAETMFSNFFKSMFDYQHKSNFLEPQKFNEQVFFQLKSQIKVITRNKITKMQEMLNNLYKRREETHVQEVRKQVRKDSFKEFQMLQKLSEKKTKSRNHKKHLSDFSNHQTGQSGENKPKSSRFQEKLDNIEDLKKQVENLKKCNTLLLCELSELKEIVKRQQQQKTMIGNMNKQLQNLFKKRSYQLQSEKAELKWSAEKSAKQTIILASQKMEIQERFHKSMRNTYRGNSNLKRSESQIDKQSQTDPVQFSHIQQAETFIFQHKPFMPLRSKMKKRTSTEAKEKTKLLQVQKAEKQLRETISRIGQFLFEKDEEKAEQKNQLEVLLKQQKFDELILKLKQKLDNIYDQVNQAKLQKQSKISRQIRSSQQQEGVMIKFKTTDKKSRSNKKNSSISSIKPRTKVQSKQNKYNQIGIQANLLQKQNQSEKTFLKRSGQRNNSIASVERQKYHRDRSKMATMMNLQSKFKLSSSQGGGISERNNQLSSTNKQNITIQIKPKTNRESGLISRFYRNSEMQSPYNETGSSYTSQGKKRNYLQNALFQQLVFDSSNNDTTRKRQSYYKKMTNCKLKQHQKKTQKENILPKKERETIRQEEEANLSSRVSEANAQDVQKNMANLQNMSQELMKGLQRLASRPQSGRTNDKNIFKGW